jgi:hypothetical protein
VGFERRLVLPTYRTSPGRSICFDKTIARYLTLYEAAVRDY